MRRTGILSAHKSIVPRSGKLSRLVGSRLPLDYARATGASFLTSGARDAARVRTSFVEPHQSFDHQRFWADLLWSPALAFNLLGDLAADLDLADRAVHALWPEVPEVVREVRVAHSPGRLDRTYLSSLREFDTVFVLELADGTDGVLAVDIKLHEWAKPETPKPSNRARNLEVANRSHMFVPGATDALLGRSELCLMWLEHLLLLSMLQHASGAWTWGRYVVVHPAGNSERRRYVRPLPSPSRRRVDILVRDARGGARHRCASGVDCGRPPRQVRHSRLTGRASAL